MIYPFLYDRAVKKSSTTKRLEYLIRYLIFLVALVSLVTVHFNREVFKLLFQ